MFLCMDKIVLHSSAFVYQQSALVLRHESWRLLKYPIPLFLMAEEIFAVTQKFRYPQNLVSQFVVL